MSQIISNIISPLPIPGSELTVILRFSSGIFEIHAYFAYIYGILELIMKSKYYIFEELLAKNQFCESWKAIDKKRQTSVFVKITSLASSGIDSKAEQLLYKSFQYQKLIGNRRIITAIRKTKEDKRLQIEYPYLSEDIYTALSMECFWKNVESLLPQIAVLLDYLHLYGLVHCDIKLENFLIKRTINGLRLYLNDLDFLKKDQSSPRGLIFGTLDHIPPEITSNEIVLCSSDSFSIGSMLKHCLSHLSGTLKHSVPEQTQNLVGEFANLLLNKDPYNRPRILIDAMVDVGLISDEIRSTLNKTIVSMKLLSTLRLSMNDNSDIREDLFEHNKIIGISDELKQDLKLSMQSNRLSTMRVFKKLLNKASVERHGDYWFLILKDCDLRSIFIELEKINKTNRPQLQDYCNTRTSHKILGTVDNLISEGHYEKAYYLSTDLFDALNNQKLSKSDSLYEKIFVNLVYLSRVLNKSEALREFLIKLYMWRKKSGIRDTKLLYEYNSQILLFGSFLSARRILTLGKLLAKGNSDQNMLTKFLVQEAWVNINEENYKEARTILINCQEIASKLDKKQPEIGVFYALGILDWRRGNLESSVEHLNRALSIASEKDLLSESISMLTGLMILLISQMNIDKAIEVGKLAVLNISENRDKSKLSRIYILLAHAHILIPDEMKARYWIQKAYPYSRVRFNRSLMTYYHLILGMIEIDSFHLNEAKTVLHAALEFSDAKENDVNICANYFQLARISFYQGKKEEFEKYLELARQMNKSLKDNISDIEIESMSALFDLFYTKDTSSDNVDSIFKKLIQNSAFNYSTVLLFYITLNSNSKNIKEFIDNLRERKVTISSKSKIQLYRIINLVHKSNEMHSSKFELKMNLLKEAYKISNDSGHRFNTFLLSQRISQLYHQTGESRQARKYMTNSHKIIEYIGNSYFLDKITKDIEEIELTSKAVGLELEGYNRIGKILGDIDNYDKSIKEIIKFAVSATGAERGVLFLKKIHDDKLRIEAYVNCDEDSLEDIKDFSSNLPKDVIANNETLTIENATKDKRTKDYKSVIRNNILSVQCTPIYYSNELIGVMYLDNHTIPALFEKNDLEYIKSMSNIIAVMIMVLRGQKDLKYINKQLLEDYNRAKGSIGFVSENKVVLDMFKLVSKFAKTNVSILLLGESGTGKEIISDMIHNLSIRKDKPFIKLNCAAMPANLIESELFGVAKRVATGVDARVGKFQAADGGTLLLDEIGDMPIDIQGKVLRVLEYQEFQPVGSNLTVSTDVRFIYATNKDLEELIRLGKFRDDLYRRIHSIDIKIPPLRERVDDILLLLEKFIKFFSNNGPAPRFSSEAIECLMNYSWPGNVRELKSFIERCCILYPGEEVSKAMLPKEFLSLSSLDNDLIEKITLHEHTKYKLALRKFDGNQSKSAKYLNIPLSTFRRKLKKFDLD